MEHIDITNEDFSLGNIPDLNEVMSNTFSSYLNDYNIYIYIAVALVLLFIIAFLVYKFYINKQKQVTFQDNQDICYDGVCHR
jgi:hypothetical protein